MKKIFDLYFRKLIFGTPSDISLEKKIFLLLMLNTSIISLIGVLFYFLNHNSILSYLSLSSLIVVKFIYVLARKGDVYKRMILPSFVFSLFYLMAHWMLNAGCNGSTPLLYLVYFVGIYTIVLPKHKKLVFYTYLLVLMALFFVNIKFSQFILGYDSGEQRLIDIVVSTIVYFLFLFIILFSILKSYSAENKRFHLINEELKRKHKDKEHWTLLVTESEERFRRIANQVPDIIFLTDELGKINFMSGASKRILGYSPEEMLGNSFLSFLHESSVDLARKEFRATLDQNVETNDLPLIIQRKDGRSLNVELNASVFYENNELKGTIGIIRDISERLMVLDEISILSKVVEQSPESIMITDVHGDIEYVNSKFCEVTGYEPSEIYGNNPKVLKSGYHDKEFYKALWDSILRGEAWKGELLNSKKSGEYYWEMTHIFPIKKENGEITHYIALKQDITERKRLMEQLISAKDRAEESDRLKSAFLANMSHEIRTPLNGILGFSKLLAKTALTEEKREKYSGIVKKNSDSLLHIVSDILDISKIESGQLEIKKVEIFLNKLVNDIHILYRNKAHADLKIKVKQATSEVVIFTDEYRLRQIFINLLDNAIKFTEKGFVQFGIEKVTAQRVYLFVEDSGIGIPQEFQDNIFKRFRQVDGVKKTQPGIGLGLAIVKQLSELMLGEIKIRSKVNDGTKFSFWLPL